ncbi:sulfatase-like hydrolase/transferase [Lignipirellula cremea]|uniref:Arylsulfatase n=1 Tax=Lignipirellula cremea TaxID=2528010 RepID=A0A518E081_9BACT|nr:sulfatase-like hydrolase/transferase [Lignipirellula cremea]QDU97471.1 Arylsulfatase [Lignipirellula cremea]
MPRGTAGRCLAISALLLLGGLRLAGSGPQAAGAERPNFLFLLADDQRGDTIAALGNQQISTPSLDRLVREGMSFTRATCSYPICWVSRSEILTGQHGWENGVTGLGNLNFADGVSFWPATFAAAGYATYTVGKWHMRPKPAECGFTGVAGFYYHGDGKLHPVDQTDDRGVPVTGYRGWMFQSGDGRTRHPDQGVGLTPDISAKFADAAISIIDKAGDQPWLLMVNFTAPHDPLFTPTSTAGKYHADQMQLPANFLPRHPFDHGNLEGRDERLMEWPRTPAAVRDVLRLYYAVIDDLDHQVGRILTRLEETGQRDRTYVIYSSDHGMAVGSHGLRGKQNMYEHTINTPLLISGPGIKPGVRTTAQVYLRELYPTTCELAGIAIPEAVTAESFAAVLRGEKQTHHARIFGYFTGSQRMVRNDRWKLIHYPVAKRWQLFDLQADPHELQNLVDAPEHAAIVADLQQQLAAWRKLQGDPTLRTDPVAP